VQKFNKNKRIREQKDFFNLKITFKIIEISKIFKLIFSSMFVNQNWWKTDRFDMIIQKNIQSTTTRHTIKMIYLKQKMSLLSLIILVN
jgi:hypothetical protein